MWRRDGDEDALLANVHSAQAVRDGYGNQLILTVDILGDSKERAQSQRSVCGIGEMSDSLGVEGVAGTTYRWRSLLSLLLGQLDKAEGSHRRHTSE